MTKSATFANGDSIPALGLGTWNMTDGSAYEAVKQAIELGYRHFDCAHIYGNELDVGAGLADVLELNQVQRSDLFVTSKLWNDCHHPDDVRGALKHTLGNLHLDYVDLYLMHWPIAHQKGVAMPESAEQFRSLEEVPLAATWQAIRKCRDAGWCRHIGVANFSVSKLTALKKATGSAPEMNQVESHPLLAQNDLLEFCKQEEILMTAYSPLGSPDRPERLRQANEPALLANDQVMNIAAKHNMTPAQVLLTWAIQRGTIVIPKSTSPTRMKENLESLSLTLDAEDMGVLAAVDRQFRFIDGQFWEDIGGPYTGDSVWS